jgi:hypothetical protein
MDPELVRKNVRLGLVLLAIAVLIIVATIVTAYVYNAAN